MSLRLTALPLAAAALGAIASAGRAQSPAVGPSGQRVYAIAGVVSDNDGRPIGGADVWLIERDSASRSVHTDDAGRFRLDGLSAAVSTLRVRRMGFKVRTLTVASPAGDQPVSVAVKLEAAPTNLPAVLVNENGDEIAGSRLAEFYARAQANNFGHFVDEKTLNALRPEFASEALRGVPGVMIRPSRRIGNIVKIRGCSPMVYVDGLRAMGAELDDVAQGANVAAIEVYSSQAGVPSQYADRRATCGTILVWMRNR